MFRLILLSGGMDSAAALAWALAMNPAACCLWVDYGQRSREREHAAAASLAEHCGVLLYEAQVMLPAGYGGSLLAGGVLQGAATIVPFRNAVTLSLAVGLADSLGCASVVIGSHQGDRAIYPDCRAEFTQAMALAALLGTTGRIRIEQPFADLRKEEVLALGNALSVPWEMTWSCYDGQEAPCQVCGACQERAKAFAQVALLRARKETV